MWIPTLCKWGRLGEQRNPAAARCCSLLCCWWVSAVVLWSCCCCCCCRAVQQQPYPTQHNIYHCCALQVPRPAVSPSILPVIRANMSSALATMKQLTSPVEGISCHAFNGDGTSEFSEFSLYGYVSYLLIM